MIGAAGPRMLRLTAELADEWNAGMRPPEELPELLAEVDAACEAAGRDPATLPRSAEALVRTIDAADGRPAEEREIRGSPAEIAAALRRYADLGMSHVQVQLRPNRLEAVEAFAPVIEALAPGLRQPQAGGPQPRERAMQSASRSTCRPSASKFSGRSHAS